MTKEAYTNYQNEMTFCKTCNKLLPTRCFYYSEIRSDGTAKKCRACSWIELHGLPRIKNLTEIQLRTIVELIFSGIDSLNRIAQKINSSLDDVVQAIRLLKIGNKKFIIENNCAYCNKSITVRPSVYLRNKHIYCSNECYWQHKPTVIERGKESKFYKRIKTNCSYCGKEIEVTPYDYNIKNTFGDNHNFCSQQCYWKYRSQYYVGEKSVAANRVYTEEQLENMKITMIKNSARADRFDSKIQLTVNSMLDKHDISYEREYLIKYYRVDNYLSDSGLMIEVMGDYWHTSPLKYNENKYSINQTQKKGLQHDKQKHTYIKTHRNIEILYLWEKDIENNPNLCEMLILKYIESKGVLQNYHSFNWVIKDDQLKLSENIIKPYQDMKASEYKHLIKTKIS